MNAAVRAVAEAVGAQEPVIEGGQCQQNGFRV